MAVEGFYSVEEQRALVYAYIAVPHGQKAGFLAEQGISASRLYRWRAQVFADTLEYGLVPRGGVMVSVEESRALQRTMKELERLQAKLAQVESDHQQELAARDEELARQRRAVDALGKAIELLHPNEASKSSEPDEEGPSPGR